MGKATDPVEPAPQDVLRAEAEVEQSRARLGELVAEVERRRHVVERVKERIQAQPVMVAVGALVGLAVAGGLLALTVSFRKARRATRMRREIARVVEHPELMWRRPPGVIDRAVGAATAAMASMLAKQMAKRLLPPPRGGAP